MMPHSHCVMFDPVLIWWAVLANLMVAIPYFALSVSMAFVLIRRRGAVPLPSLAWVFTCFIFCCAGTHVHMACEYKWAGYYWYNSWSSVTAAVSLLAVPMFLRALPVLLTYTPPEQLEEEKRAAREARAVMHQQIDILESEIAQLREGRR